MRGGFAEPLERFALVLVRADADFGKVAARVFGLGETGFGSLFRPQVGFGVGLREDAGRTDKIPGGEGETSRGMVLLGGDVCED